MNLIKLTLKFQIQTVQFLLLVGRRSHIYNDLVLERELPVTSGWEVGGRCAPALCSCAGACKEVDDSEFLRWRQRWLLDSKCCHSYKIL